MIKNNGISIAAMFTEIRDENDGKPIEPNISSIGILPLRDIVAFPFMPANIDIGRDSSLELVKEAESSHQFIFVVTQKDASIENPSAKDLYKVGTLCRVMKVIERPDGIVSAFIIAESRYHLDRILKRKPYLRGQISKMPMPETKEDGQEINNMLEVLNELYGSMLSMIGDDEARELRFGISQYNNDPERIISFIASHSPITTEERQKILETSDMKKAINLLLQFLATGKQKLNLKVEIQSRTHEELTRRQKEAFLRQQIQQIEAELNDGNPGDYSDIEEFKEKAKEKKWNENVQKHFDKELAKLERLSPQTPDYSVQFTYLETFLSLPWDNQSDSKVDLKTAREILDRDHYGMDDVKERIIEHLAVLKLRDDMKAPIICLYGPPGVGKTSLGKSIAEALGREYRRVALGGVHDEAEIRGHRRTYIGAMPGRILSALAKCGSSNPVFVLDEIDKLGADMKGDPSTALLEVLDPEQNNAFHDNYVDYDYDLSKVMFIATANQISSISRPLLDRMEIIELSGYTAQEKVEIGRLHLVPKVLEEHGFDKDELTFSDDALRFIIDFYTRESGVRTFYKKLSKVVRKIACRKVSDEEYPKCVDTAYVKDILGREEQLAELYETNEYAGVVTGLAWTQTGGDILFIETSVSKGKGDKLTLTGNLGDVMKESATIALQYIKANSGLLGLEQEAFENLQLHIHVPEGAIPKDGPSAGITMATSIASALTRRKVREKVAMTGEITLRGKVLPVGGLKEKILAASRAGITDIVLSQRNRPDIEKLPDYCREGLAFHYVDRVEEVLEYALLDDIALH